MALEQDLELIDNYLSNRMDGSEKEAFEKRLQQDHALSNELKLQQSLVQGIRQARMVELKSMLNSIPVTNLPPSQSAVLTKIGGWVLVGGLIATTAFFYFNQDENTTAVNAPAVEQPKNEQPISSQNPETTKPVTEGPEIKSVEKTEPKRDTRNTNEAVETKPALEVYDPTEEINETTAQKFEQEQLEIISKAFVTSSIEVETINTNKQYNFHYVFNDGRLVLYGSFEKNLYEILEFINQDKRTVVLYYKKNYYLLDINKSTPTLLTTIKNQQLLKKLHDSRKE